jgi:hypothetical protein
VSVKFIASESGLAMQMPAKTFTELLALARSEGWDSQGFPEDWCGTSADTEVIVRKMDARCEGLVSDADARGLSEALGRVLVKGFSELSPHTLVTILDFNNVLKGKGFTVTKVENGETAFFHR